MRGILADVNIEGILGHLGRIWLSGTWRQFWFDLGISIESFESLGLQSDASDATIWRVCQEQSLVLITANRNADEPGSLELVIRGENQPESLPVITLADARRVLRERLCAEKAAEQILDYFGAHRSSPRIGATVCSFRHDCFTVQFAADGVGHVTKLGRDETDFLECSGLPPL